MNVKCFANYGCLAAEKQVIYTVGIQHANAGCYEKGTLVIPDSLNPYITEIGEVAVEMGGYRYLINEVLYTGKDGLPVARWIDKSGRGCSQPLSFIKDEGVRLEMRDRRKPK